MSVLCPGLTNTRILDAPEREDPDAKPMASEGDPDALFNSMDGAMDPIEVGRAVVRGIRENLPYILSHGEFRDEIRVAVRRDRQCLPDGSGSTGGPSRIRTRPTRVVRQPA